MNEERIQRLEGRCAAIETELRELKARGEISDLMGRYALYYSAGCGERLVDELWLSDDSVSVEYGASGIFQGLWKVKSFYVNEPIPGKLSTIAFSSPVLRVDAGGARARGVWTAFGTETDPGDLGPAPVTARSNRRVLLSSETEDGKQYRAEVLLQKYAVDFRLDADGWRIQRLHVIEYYRCPYDRDWVRYAAERFVTDGMWLESLFETPMPFPPESHGENLPSHATSEHWQYTTGALPKLLPTEIP